MLVDLRIEWVKRERNRPIRSRSISVLYPETAQNDKKLRLILPHQTILKSYLNEADHSSFNLISQPLTEFRTAIRQIRGYDWSRM